MGNCLQYICPSYSSEEQKEPTEVSVPDPAKEEQRATESKTHKPEKSGRSACSTLPSIDIDLPVLIRGGKRNSTAKDADGNTFDNLEKGKLSTTDGVQRLFFQSSSDSSLQICDGAKIEDGRKALDLPTPEQLTKNVGVVKNEEMKNICNKPGEKSKKSLRKKLHLPKIKIKPVRKSRRVAPFDDGITGGLPLLRGADEECELTHTRLKPLGIVHSQMPKRSLKADDIFLAVHKNAPNEQNSSSVEGLGKHDKELKASSLPLSLQMPSWKEMYRKLIKSKELAVNEHVDTPAQKLTEIENGGKVPTRRKRKRSRAQPKRCTVEEDDATSGLPLFRGCDVLESTQAILFEDIDQGYLASGEESD